MVNLVGAEGFTNVVYENMEKILGWTGVTPHILKKMTRPFRKMGHVTIVNSDEEARRIAEAVKKTLSGDKSNKNTNFTN
jgi:5-(carboxyamino)imidazole ribonucleotide synthase